jgi:hypothetical protein
VGCDIPVSVNNAISVCYGSSFHEDRETFGKNNEYKWEDNAGGHDVIGKVGNIFVYFIYNG